MNIKRQTLLYFLLISVFCSAFQGDKKTPTVLMGKLAQTPTWVSVEEAVNQNGQIDPFWFSVQHASALERLSQAQLNMPKKNVQEGSLNPFSDCPLVVSLNRSFIEEHPSASYDDLIKFSEIILLGKIVEISHGFCEGSPSSLLTLEVEKVVRGDFVTKGYIYVEYPLAHFSAGGTTFCRRDNGVPHGAFVGGRIQLFLYKRGYTDHPLLFRPDVRTMVVETIEGHASISPSLKGLSQQKAMPLFENWAHDSEARVKTNHQEIQKNKQD